MTREEGVGIAWMLFWIGTALIALMAWGWWQL